MSNLHIEIPKPCPASWSVMTPNEEGRHCTACNKTVIDFTAMSNEEIKVYFLAKNDEKVCGRFHAHQVTTASYNAWQKKLITAYSYVDHRVSYRLARTAALLLLTTAMTLSGCGEKTTGESVPLESADTLRNVSCDTANETKNKPMSIKPHDQQIIESSIAVGEAYITDTLPHSKRPPKIETVKFVAPEITPK